MSITGNRVELIRRVDLGSLAVELYQDPNSDMVYHGNNRPIGRQWTLVLRGDDFVAEWSRMQSDESDHVDLIRLALSPSDLYALRDLLTEVVAAATAEAESLEEE